MKVAFVGHGTIGCTKELYKKLEAVVENLIINEGAEEFLFGSKSAFDNLCYKTVTRLKTKYAHISRLYIRAVYENLDEQYEQYLLSLYERTVFPKRVGGSYTASYVVRNEAMIDDCDTLVIYYDENYIPVGRNRYAKSGTKLAVEYALRKNIRIINVFG